MTCIECGKPPIVFPDNVILSVHWSAGKEYIYLDNDPRGKSATPWCQDHFPRWLWGTHRVPRVHKPHINVHGNMTDRMRTWAEVAAAARRITEPIGGESS